MKQRIRLASLLFALLFSAPSAFATAAPNGSQFHRYGRTQHVAQRPSIAYGQAIAQRAARHSNPWRGYESPACRVWVPGRWTVQTHKVWVPGACEKVWRPAQFETRFDLCGKSFQVQLSPGRYETIVHPGGWQYREEKVWQGPHWETR